MMHNKSLESSKPCSFALKSLLKKIAALKKNDLNTQSATKNNTVNENEIIKDSIAGTKHNTPVFQNSAIVDGEESEPTSFQEVHVPPRIGSFEQPVLIIEERVNGSVTLVINNADKNHHCKVLTSH